MACLRSQEWADGHFRNGYSSLSYLQGFPFDKLKIDRSFIDRLASGGPDDTLVEAIAAMGHSLRTKVTAEGVETMARARHLCDLACDELQGYLFAQPMSRTSVDAYLEGLARLAEAS